MNRDRPAEWQAILRMREPEAKIEMDADVTRKVIKELTNQEQEFPESTEIIKRILKQYRKK